MKADRFLKKYIEQLSETAAGNDGPIKDVAIQV